MSRELNIAGVMITCPGREPQLKATLANLRLCEATEAERAGFGLALGRPPSTPVACPVGRNDLRAAAGAAGT